MTKKPTPLKRKEILEGEFNPAAQKTAIKDMIEDTKLKPTANYSDLGERENAAYNLALQDILTKINEI